MTEPVTTGYGYRVNGTNDDVCPRHFFYRFCYTVCDPMPEREQEFTKSEEGSRPSSECNVPQPLFEGGWVLATPKALAALTEAELELMDVLARHLVGDWGDIGEEERLLNDLAVVHGQRITSAYQLPTGQEIWVVTASHRDMTWLKFPEQADPE